MRKFIILGLLLIIPFMAQARYNRHHNGGHTSTPKPPVPPTPPVPPVPPTVPTVPTLLQLGGFMLNAGTVEATFNGWNDAPSSFAGKTTLIYWENYGVSLDSIINGSQDSVIKAFGAKLAPNTIISLFHEMNLSDGSNSWAGYESGNTAAKVVQAYKHVHDLIGTKAKWAWVVNNVSVPNVTGNEPAAYWPGAAYVDYIGVDAFDFDGNSPLSTVAQPALNEVLGYGKPVWITSCGTTSSNKAVWVSAAIAWAKSNNIGGLIYFNYNDGGNFELNSAGVTAFHL